MVEQEKKPFTSTDVATIERRLKNFVLFFMSLVLLLTIATILKERAINNQIKRTAIEKNAAYYDLQTGTFVWREDLIPLKIEVEEKTK
jgi:hypothetical protein